MTIDPDPNPWQSRVKAPPAPAIVSGLQAFVHWAIVWGQIADEHLTRAEAVRATMFEGDPESAKYEQELYACLVAIAASAFAVESEAQRIQLADASTRPTLSGRSVNRGDWIGAALVERGRFTTDEAQRLGDVFDLRNESVHPTHVWEEEFSPNPAGCNQVAAPYRVYALEVARAAVGIAKKAIAAI